MEKKVKSLDITTLLSLIFYIAGICFTVMGYVFITNDGNPFELSGINFSEPSGVAKLLFIIGCVFIGLGIVSGVVVGILYLITDWGNEELNKKTKLAGILNLIPVTFSIPANIVTKSLVKEFVHDGPKKSSKKYVDEQAQTKEKVTSQQNPTTTQQSTQAQPTNAYVAPSQTSSFVAPIGQSFMYNNKWMYFDGTTYYEADANNQWVVSSTIPH